MKLQINDSGAWRNVVTFLEAEATTVKRGAAAIGEGVAMHGAHVGFRLVDDEGKVAEHWNYTDGWTRPRWAAVAT